MTKEQIQQALDEFPIYSKHWKSYITYDFFYDEGARSWVRSYMESFTEDGEKKESPTKWYVYDHRVYRAGVYHYGLYVEGVYSPKGNIWSKDELLSKLSLV